MLTYNLLIVISLIYVLALFGVAFLAERSAVLGRSGWLRSPLTYTLSLSVYCTAWTFYGAVGNAARSGLEFLTIYLGPTLIFLAWWWLLRKLVRIGQAERITSIADLISSRYGKSPTLAVLVTILAVVGTTPYIALQLQSVTLSFAVFAEQQAQATGQTWGQDDLNATALYVACGLALFTLLFGTRNLDKNERHYGVVIAIAIEAVVKLVALLSVGIFVVWGVSGGLSDMLLMIEASPVAEWNPDQGRWVGLTCLSAMAIICLPRMFQVMVVEYTDERSLATASWAFPLYLMAMSLFVIPIAVAGLTVLPEGANPDLFVLTLPMAMGQESLAMFAFLGGFSSATSMVIVAAIALSTMVSNHIVLPLWLSMSGQGATMSGDVRNVVILSRRLSILAVLALGYAYFRVSGGTTALSAIGLVSFAGVSQVFPALIAGLFWRGATRRGAFAAIATGFLVWAYTLFLPAIGGLPDVVMNSGLFGISILRPQGLLGMSGLDPLVHSIFWSLLLNTAALIVVSLLTFPTPLERLQGASFVTVFRRGSAAPGYAGGQAETEDFLVMAQRLLGPVEAQQVFQAAARSQQKSGGLPDPTPEFVDRLERELAGRVGAATAHAMISQINGQASISVQDLLAVADESAQILEYSSQLETKSAELEKTAKQLRDANAQLRALSIQKDAFLSQVSHELRTPMTSIRSFSEILMDENVKAQDKHRFSNLIQDEAKRLTRLLDDLLDLSVLENGQVVLNRQVATLSDVIDRAIASAGLDSARAGEATESQLRFLRDPAQEQVELNTDTDRLCQVFINLITNAQKYCDVENPELRISVLSDNNRVQIDMIDNGAGVEAGKETIIFEKFSRATDQTAAGSAGLGLAISREILKRLGGSIEYITGRGGAAFRIVLPSAQMSAAAE